MQNGLVVAARLSPKAGPGSAPFGPDRTVTVERLLQLLAATPAPLLVDIREPEEVAVNSIPNSVHVPLMSLADAWDELKQRAGGRLIVLYCRSGGRTAFALESLLGGEQYPVVHLAGGQREYARLVDPSLTPA